MKDGRTPDLKIAFPVLHGFGLILLKILLVGIGISTQVPSSTNTEINLVTYRIKQIQASSYKDGLG